LPFLEIVDEAPQLGLSVLGRYCDRIFAISVSLDLAASGSPESFLPHAGGRFPKVGVDDCELRSRGNEIFARIVINKLGSGGRRGKPMDPTDLTKLSRERCAPRAVERLLE
jgi:hypothetical protein